MAQLKKIYKTTIVIWTDVDPETFRGPHESVLVNLAREAVDGVAYCSKQECVEVDYPPTINGKKDPDWDNTEFFEDNEDYLNLDKSEE